MNKKIKSAFDFSTYSPARWVAFFGCFLALVVIAFVIYGALNLKDGEGWENIWFGSLQYFTQQSNLIVCVFYFIYFINPNSKIFKKNIFLIFTISYISVTFIGFNFFLAPAFFIGGVYTQWTVANWISTYLFHAFNPLYMLTLYILIVKNLKYDKKQLNWGKNLSYGIIYPVVYLIYAAILPFVYPDSVYGSFTNLNPDFSYKFGDIEIPGNPFNILFMLGFLLFFVLTLWVYHYMIHKSIKKRRPHVSNHLNTAH